MTKTECFKNYTCKLYILRQVVDTVAIYQSGIFPWYTVEELKTSVGLPTTRSKT